MLAVERAKHDQLGPTKMSQRSGGGDTERAELANMACGYNGLAKRKLAEF